MHTAARVFLYFQVLGLALFGVWFLVQPTTAGAVIGLSAISTAGVSELRSLLFGVFVSWSVLLWFGLRKEPRILSVVAFAMAMVVLGRLVSWLIDGMSLPALGAAFLELLIAVSCLVAMSPRADTTERRQSDNT